MITVFGGADRTPSMALRSAINRHRKTLGIEDYDRFGTALAITPRSTLHPWSPDDPWWYQLHWAIPAVCQHPQRVLDTCTERDHLPVVPDDPIPQWRHVGWEVIGDVCRLSAPPRLQKPSVTEDEIDAAEARQPGVTQWIGGREEVRKWLQGHIDQAWTGYPPPDQLDWDRYVLDTIKPLCTEMRPPKLTTEMRVKTAGARYMRALKEVGDAEASIAGLILNDHRANVAAGTEWGEQTRWHEWTGMSRTTLGKMLKEGPNGIIHDDSAPDVAEHAHGCEPHP